MGERLGRFIGQYRNAYFTPDKRNGQIIFSYKPLPGAEDAIYDKISDITISMKSTDHLKMPELINSQYMVHLSEEERQRYEELKRDLVLSPSMERLRRLTQHPHRENCADGQRCCLDPMTKAS